MTQRARPSRGASRGMADDEGTANADERSKKYIKLSQLDQITTRPGMYLGSIVSQSSPEWACALVSEADVEQPKTLNMFKKTITFVPALLKLFDEMLTNAMDAAANDDTVTQIKITVAEKTFSVLNNGKGIPVSKHSEYSNVWVPDMVFGHLNTSSNYDDSVERVTAGVNGLGIKLVNAFSKKFIINIKDSTNSSIYYQEWYDQMSKKSDTKIRIKDVVPATGFVDVLSQPLDALFGPAAGFTSDYECLFLKRAADAAAATPEKVLVYYNDTKMPVRNFKQYCKAVAGDRGAVIALDDTNAHWKVGVIEAGDAGVIALVNGTSSLGAHVAYIEKALYGELTKLLETKREFKSIGIKPAQLKSNVLLVLFATVSQPQFSSQTKEFCVSYANRLSDWKPAESFLNKILKSNIVANAAAAEMAKTQKKLAKATDGKLVSKISVPKLVDAIKAGTSQSHKCTLIVCEGDSAKAFAVAGLSVVGHDYYGVFPLKGKMLNVKEASHKQLLENTEIKNLKIILGLKQGETHVDTNALQGSVVGLRYGKVLVLTDADVDGSHISALFINFIHFNWPTLATIGFIQKVQTPIIKVFAPASKGGATTDFFSVADFKSWSDANNNGAGHKIKYFKGLGTSTSAEAKDIFKKLRPVQFMDTLEDANKALILAFDSKKTDERKSWILHAIDAADVAQTGAGGSGATPSMTISDFVNKELVEFSIYNVSRSIPNIVDGLKTVQRKTLYTVLSRGYTNANKEVKVAQLSGAVAELTLYLHGENSVSDAIIGMAQNFVGANNFPLLVPQGQFGTRMENGSDAASARYIYTYGTDKLRQLFKKEDDDLLVFKYEEGKQVEPDFFLPVVPMVLVNGAHGIGTGFSTSIPMYNMKDIVAKIRSFISDDASDVFTEDLVPFYEGFKGTIQKVGDGKFVSTGVATPAGGLHVEIIELPVGSGPGVRSFSDYATWLSSEGSPVKLIENRCIDLKPYFKVAFATQAEYDAATPKLAEVLKLTTHISVKNMHLFDKDGKIKKYDSALSILKEWTAFRLTKYADLKDFMLAQMHTDCAILRSKMRFIQEVLDGAVDFKLITDEQLVAYFRENNYASDGRDAFDYLLSIQARFFTVNKVTELQIKIKNKEAALAALQQQTAQALWLDDLAALGV